MACMLKLTGQLEHKVLSILWEHSAPLKPCDVQKNLPQAYAYSTVKTALERLHRKGVIDRCKEGNVYWYHSKLSKPEYAKQHLGSVYQQLIEAYGEAAVTQFLQALTEYPELAAMLKQAN
jgi:BlaI family penicillinase repressor